MRERAALSAARSNSCGRAKAGTLVRVQVPLRTPRAQTRMPDRITVLLADDHSLVRRGFRRLLEDDPAIDVVGEASDGGEASSSPPSSRRGHRHGLRHAGNERTRGDAPHSRRVAEMRAS